MPGRHVLRAALPPPGSWGPTCPVRRGQTEAAYASQRADPRVSSPFSACRCWDRDPLWHSQPRRQPEPQSPDGAGGTCWPPGAFPCWTSWCPWALSTQPLRNSAACAGLPPLPGARVLCDDPPWLITASGVGDGGVGTRQGPVLPLCTGALEDRRRARNVTRPPPGSASPRF